MKDKITVGRVIELYDPAYEGKKVTIIEDKTESSVCTESLMLWEISDIPIVGIGVDEWTHDLKLWLDDQAVKEQWERATT